MQIPQLLAQNVTSTGYPSKDFSEIDLPLISIIVKSGAFLIPVPTEYKSEMIKMSVMTLIPIVIVAGFDKRIKLKSVTY
ncbi:MAG: hypothetical protein ACC653_05425 [Gammaproteobacteria bacterium]